MKAWVEGKKRVGPWKVRWREKVDGAWVKRASASFRTQSDAMAELDAVNARLAKAAALLPARGRTLIPLTGDLDADGKPASGGSSVLERWASDSLASEKIGPFYADEVTRTLTKLCKAQGWQHTNHVTASAVAAWRSEKKRGHTRPTAMLKTLMRWARAVLKQPIDEELLHLPIKQGIPRGAPTCLTPAQVELIIARALTFGENVGTAIAHQALFGCRPADICRLNVGDWDPRTRTLTLQATKSRTRPSHPIGGHFAAHADRLDRITANRMPASPLFINPSGERWKPDRNGGSRQLGDWYWWHVTNKLPEIPATHRGISCLKDYAITNLDAAGVDDRTKTLFTGHRSLSVYARYKATNAERANEALVKLGAVVAPSGGRFGGSSNLRGQKRGQARPPAKTRKEKKPGTSSKRPRARSA